MDKESAKALYESVDISLAFRSYYKYSFVFAGENESVRVTATYGGSADDIYRYDVDTEAKKAPKTFEALMEEYYIVKIENLKTGEIFEDYHY